MQLSSLQQNEVNLSDHLTILHQNIPIETVFYCTKQK